MQTYEVLRNLLSDLPSKFTFEGDEYVLSQYGGPGPKSWCLWLSGSKGIALQYSLKKVGDDAYSGLDTIYGIEIWGDYHAGRLIGSWENRDVD